ncbi:hypothetical protein HanOQP8_Chr12g0442791 [Helianthus annuus]|nr:hypothetical protein HanOQP8_Chr12g0442791 [Helianthus annuus]
MLLHIFCLIQFRHDVFLSFKFEDIPPLPAPVRVTLRDPGSFGGAFFFLRRITLVIWWWFEQG